MSIKFTAVLILLSSFFSISANAASDDNSQKDTSLMKNVLIIGANGRTSAEIIPRLLEIKDVKLRLFLRQASRLDNLKSERVELFEGDATRSEDLEKAMEGETIVISTMGGMDLDKKTQNIVNAMTKTNVQRLIVISAGGIWDELPEPFNTYDKAMVGSYRPINRRTAEVVESSGLDYTVLRPVWLNDKPTEKYTLTFKGETYKGRSTSRASIARLIADIVKEPARFSHKDIGISQDGTE